MSDDQQKPQRDSKGRLAKGVRLNPHGRPKGGQNKFTKDLKTMIEEALNRAGENAQKKRRSLKDLEPGIAYLVKQADERPELFMPLVRQLLPAKLDVEVSVMTQQMAGLLHERRDQLAALRDNMDEAEVIEHEEDTDNVRS